jgi:hypothetical protein
VCEDHYDRELAVCEVCATELRQGGAKGSDDGPTGRGGHDVDDDDVLR